ncbi:MAG TPA: hypothetical protein VHO70_14300 [Chitinispirillaceae bacterium]|nr:hypothetical protein [Chitinispirillaceae bacterium]
MNRIISVIIFTLLIQAFSFLLSCGGGFGCDSENADDIGNEIFGSDSGK